MFDFGIKVGDVVISTGVDCPHGTLGDVTHITGEGSPTIYWGDDYGTVSDYLPPGETECYILPPPEKELPETPDEWENEFELA